MLTGDCVDQIDLRMPFRYLIAMVNTFQMLRGLDTTSHQNTGIDHATIGYSGNRQPERDMDRPDSSIVPVTQPDDFESSA